MMSWAKKNRKYILGVLVIVGLWYFFGRSGEPKDVYVTEPLALEDIRREISLTGSLESRQVVDVQTSLAEIVETIEVSAGDEVKKGDVLIRLDDRQLQVRFEQAQAALASAQARLDLVLEGASFEDRAISNQEIVRSQSVYENTKKVLDQVKEVNAQTYEQALVELTLAEQEYEAALTRLKNTQNTIEDENITSQKGIQDAYNAAQVAFNNAWLGVLDVRAEVNSVVKRDPEYSEYNRYSGIEFGTKNSILSSNVRYDYDAYTSAIDLFRVKVVPYVNGWESDERVEDDLGRMLALLNTARDLVGGAIDVVDYTQVQDGLNAASLAQVRQTLVAQYSEISALYSAVQNALQGIENAKIGDQGVSSRTGLSLNDAQAVFERAKINKQRAQENVDILSVQNDQKILDIENQIDQAQQQVRSAQKNYAKTVADPRDSEVAGPKAQVKEAEARLAQAKLDLENTIILSPIDGVVTKVHTEIGQRAIPNTPLVRVIDPELEMVANVSETDIGEVAVGQTASVTFDAFSPKDRMELTIDEIDPAETVIQGVIYYQVRFFVPESSLALRSGMTTNIDVLIREKKGVLGVDSQAVAYEDGKSYVEVYKEGDEESTQVFFESGMEGDQYIEVLDGLKEGDPVVLYKD